MKIAYLILFLCLFSNFVFSDDIQNHHYKGEWKFSGKVVPVESRISQGKGKRYSKVKRKAYIGCFWDDNKEKVDRYVSESECRSGQNETAGKYWSVYPGYGYKTFNIKVPHKWITSKSASPAEIICLKRQIRELKLYLKADPRGQMILTSVSIILKNRSGSGVIYDAKKSSYLSDDGSLSIIAVTNGGENCSVNNLNDIQKLFKKNNSYIKVNKIFLINKFKEEINSFNTTLIRSNSTISGERRNKTQHKYNLSILEEDKTESK